MNEDGTGQAAAMTPGVYGVYGVPSSRTYGGSRWWLAVDIDPVTGLSEVFAFRSDASANVQLPEWAHDGSRIAFYTVNTSSYGGTLTILTKDLPQTLGKSPEAWVPLSP